MPTPNFTKSRQKDIKTNILKAVKNSWEILKNNALGNAKTRHQKILQGEKD